MRSSIAVSAVLLALALVVGCATPRTSSPPASREEGAARIEPGRAFDLRIETRCSPTEVRTGIARLAWTDGEGGGARIEVTVFADGFDHGVYAWAPAEGGPFEPSEGLRKMKRPPGRPFAIAAVPQPKDEREREIAVDVRPLEPSLLYRFRVVRPGPRGPLASREVVVEAPVCIADMEVGR